VARAGRGEDPLNRARIAWGEQCASELVVERWQCFKKHALFWYWIGGHDEYGRFLSE